MALNTVDTTQKQADTFITHLVVEGDRRREKLEKAWQQLQQETTAMLAEHDRIKPGVSRGDWDYHNPGKLVNKCPEYVPWDKRNHCTLSVVIEPKKLSVADCDRMLDELSSCWNEIIGQREK